MSTNIRTSNFALTPVISDYVARRMEKIDKLIANDPSAKCDIELARTTGHHQKGDIFKAEMHIIGADKNCFASSEQSDLYAAIDIVRDSIFRELTGAKAKQTSRVRRGGARIKAMAKGLWPWSKN